MQIEVMVMQKQSAIMLLSATVVGCLLPILYFTKHETKPEKTYAKSEQQRAVAIEDARPSEMPGRFDSYEQVTNQLKTWSRELPKKCDFGSYGRTSKGHLVNYIRIGNKAKPRILVQAGLGGQEEAATLASMSLAHRLLCGDSANSWVLNNRNVYIVPVASPDLFDKQFSPPDFPSMKDLNPVMPSCAKLFMEFANGQKFSACMSFHSSGDSLVMPSTMHEKDAMVAKSVLRRVSDLSGYAISDKKSGDVDWLYSSGAMSVGVNWGHKEKRFVAYDEVEADMDRVYDGLLAYMKDAPEAGISPIPLPMPHFYQGD